MRQEKGMHPFDEAVALTMRDSVYLGKTSEAYDNMIGAFGGITAANLLKAVFEHPERIGEPISLTINFASALKEGDFIITATPKRTGRSTQHWFVELRQKDRVVIIGTAVFAKRRKTWSDTEIKFPKIPGPEKIPSIPTVGLPSWVKNYDIKIVKGIPNLAKPKIVEDSTTIQWIKDQPSRPLDFLSLTSICDAFFPRIIVKRNEMMMIGTVSLTIYFHVKEKTLDEISKDYVLAKAWASKFYNGFFDQAGEIWSIDGELLATTHQIVYFRKSTKSDEG